MITNEKINIYVPQQVAKVLENDAIMFEIYKKDGRTINKNRFLSLIIKGYYEDYAKESKKAYDFILKTIKTRNISKEEKDKIASSILNNVILPHVPSRKGKNPKRLSLKPTTDTWFIIQMIMTNLGKDDFISQYFCRMLMSYCEKPFSKREQIVFKDKYDFLSKACFKHNCISFQTIWNVEKIHTVIPYKICVGPEELYNYLLCAEIDEESENQEVKSYRLNRINNITYDLHKSSISKNTQDYLDQMIEYGPQYVINDDEIICVKLTESGIKSFNRIYYGRPKVDREEKEGDITFLYFKCSKDQVFLYFRRFNAYEAEILEPLWLREKMIKFHKESAKAYKTT